MAAVAERGAEAAVDVGSFAGFVERTLPRIYGYFLRRCGGVATVAEDLTQEPFLAAVGELRRRGTVDAPVPWLYGIARHKLLDHYRRRSRGLDVLVPWRDGIEETSVRPPPNLGPEDDYHRVVAALARLPAGQRETVVLRYLDGLSVPATAAAVGKSVHAVESLLARGRANLKRALEEVEAGRD
jgi:RNA polymerase sigma-70 factor (ECF subfamily)